MKMKKVIGSVTHLFELPDNLARQMLAAHPGVYFVADEEPAKEGAQEENEPMKEPEQPVQPAKKPGKRKSNGSHNT